MGLVAFILVLVLTVRASTLPAPVHYAKQLHEQVLARQMALHPGADDRWDDFVGELAKLDPWRDQPSGWHVPNEAFGPLFGQASDANARAQAQELFDRMVRGGAFDAAARITSIDVAVRPIAVPVDEPMMMILLPELTRVRFLAEAQRARIALAARQGGDPAERLAALRENLALARLVSWQGCMIDHRIAGRIATETVGLTIDTLRAHPIEDASWLVAADAAIAHAMAGWAPLTHALDGEDLFARDALQRVHSHSGRFLPSAASELWGSGETAREMARDYGGPLSESEAWLRRISSAARAAMEASGSDILAADLEYKDARGELADLGAGPHRPWPAVSYVLGSYDRVIGEDRLRRITLAGARVVLAIERYRLATGQPPESLEVLGDLLPAGLASDPVTDQAWNYQRTGNGYTLSSHALPGHEPEGETDPDPLAGVAIVP